MARSDPFDLSRTLAVLLAGGAGTRLHELCAQEAKPALPFAGHRIVDFPMAALVAAGLPRVVAALQHHPETLARHLPEAWGGRISLSLCEGSRPGAQGTVEALIRCLEGEDGWREVLVLPADQVHALDLAALVAAHRESGAPATLAEPPCTSLHSALGPCLFDIGALRAALAVDARDSGSTHALWSDLLPRLAGQRALATWSPAEPAYWRDIDTLDDFREAALDFARGEPPCPLPPGEATGPIGESSGDLAIEAGGLTLTAPRFGARDPGRWTLLEDTIVMPGARVASGARLSRAIVAPGAIVPAGLTVGEDPEEDARWFRVTSAGTTLVTSQMLARRAAERMRARIPSPPAGLATSGPR